MNPKRVAGLVKPIAKSGEEGGARPWTVSTLRALYFGGTPARSETRGTTIPGQASSRKACTQVSQAGQHMTSRPFHYAQLNNSPGVL